MPWVAILIVVVVAVLLASRRRKSRAVSVVLPVMQPTFQRPNGGGAMRRSFWCVVIVLIALAAIFQGVTVLRTDARTPATVAIYEHGYAPAPEIVPEAVEVDLHPVAPAKAVPARKKAWFKSDPPTAVEPGPPWKGEIKLSTFPSVPAMNPRDKFRDIVVHRLHAELHLHVLPPPRFADNTAWVRKVELERKTLEAKDPNYGEVEVIRYEVELTPKGLEELSRLEQAERAETRMELAARGLGLITILLGAIAAFIRLDEWTKGYYSIRLFLAATAAVVGLGAIVIKIN
jgi:hypothetical protein